MNQQQHRLMQIIQKIELFKGLTPEEAQYLLQIAQPQTFDLSQLIYKTGDPSNDMLILLQGQLLVKTKSGEVLGEILPGNITGEMGMFTLQPRSADIVAIKKSGGITIRKMNLDILMAKHPEMHVKVLQNIVAQLCNRLGDSNKQAEKSAGALSRMQEKFGTLRAEGE